MRPLTPKEYLMQIYDLNKEIDSKLSERQEIMSTLVKSTDTSKESIRTLDVGRPTEETVLRLMQYNDQANNYIDELADLKIQIAEEIMQLENGNHRMVLRERYIKCKKWEEVAVEQGYDLRWIYRLHGNALKEFEDIFPHKFNSPC